ncbi:MAG: type II toxin-antitoxin system VapC family toxin [Candidatus Nanohaloarchaea archaeon]
MRKERNYFADTSFLIDLVRNHTRAEEIVADARVETGTVCIFELSCKVDFSLREIRDNVIHPFTTSDSRKAGELYRELRESGEMINRVDYLIAAQAANRGLTLLTADEDFRSVPDLELSYYR